MFIQYWVLACRILLLLLLVSLPDCKSVRTGTLLPLKFWPRGRWPVQGRHPLNLGGFELSRDTTPSAPCSGHSSLDPPQPSYCFCLDSKHTAVSWLILAGGAQAISLYVSRWFLFFFFLSQGKLPSHLRDHKSRKKFSVADRGLGLELGKLGLNPSSTI